MYGNKEAIVYFQEELNKMGFEGNHKRQHYLTALKAIRIDEERTKVDLKDTYWTNSKGTKMEFNDMTSKHLQNVLAMLKKCYNPDELRDSPLYVELGKEYMSRNSTIV